MSAATDPRSLLAVWLRGLVAFAELRHAAERRFAITRRLRLQALGARELRAWGICAARARGEN